MFEKDGLVPEKKFKSLEEEIDYLKSKVQSFEKKFQETPEHKRAELPHVEIEKSLRKYAQSKPEEIYEAPLIMSESQKNEIILDLEPEEHDATMSEMLGYIHEKGILNTLKIIETLKNPHIEDDFHRFLIEYLRQGHGMNELKKESKIQKELNHTLYEISVPSAKENENENQLQVTIAKMEQLLASISSVSDNKKIGKEDETFCFEIVSPAKSEDYAFYFSIPAHADSLFEGQILSLFPDVRIKKERNDTNIFLEEGFNSVSFAVFKEHPALPIKTYEDFETDPIGVIAKVFSTIKNNEGLAIQIVYNPVGDKYVEDFKEKIKSLEKGFSVKEVLPKKTNFFKAMAKEAGKQIVDSMKTKSADKKDEPKPESPVKPQIEKKISSNIFSTNIRIASSTLDQNRSDVLRRGIEAAFKQFDNTMGNSITFETIESFKKQQQFIRDFIFRSYNYEHELPLNLAEASTILHIPDNLSSVASKVKEMKTKFSPAPTNLPNDGIILGKNVYQGEEKEIHFSPEDRLRHFYVIGQTGTGKTTILKNMIVQDIINGEGVCFIDPHGSDIQEILARIPPERYEDIIYFDPGNVEMPMGLNMLEYDPKHPEHKTFVVNEMLSIFDKLFDMKATGGPMFEQYFRNSTMLVIEDPETGNTLLDISRVLSNKEFRDLKISRCKNPLVVQFWKEIAEKAGGESSLANIVPYVTSKFDVFLSNEIMRPIVAQEKSSLNFKDIMENKKILLVNLSKGRLGEINSSLLGLIIVGKILMATLARVDSENPNFPPFYLYIDEFQNVTTDSISQILSEARKYRLSLNIAHQFIAQLEEGIKDSVFGNVGSMAIYRTGFEDAKFLEEQLKPVFSASDIVNLDNHNSFVRILANGQPATPFSMQNILADRPVIDERVKKLKELSAYKYGKPKALIEEEIMNKFKKAV